MPLPNVDAATLTLILQFCERKAADGPRLASEAEAAKRLAAEAEAALADADAALAEAAALERRLAAEVEAAARRTAEAKEQHTTAAGKAAAAKLQAETADAASKDYSSAIQGANFRDWEKAFVAELQPETLLAVIAVRLRPSYSAFCCLAFCRLSAAAACAGGGLHEGGPAHGPDVHCGGQPRQGYGRDLACLLLVLSRAKHRLCFGRQVCGGGGSRVQHFAPDRQ